MEETLVLIKPDGVQRKLVGDIIKRFEKVGLNLVGLKILKPSADILEKHYPLEPEWIKELAKKTRESFIKKGITLKESDLEIGKRVQLWLTKSLGSGLVVAMVLRGNKSIEIVRKLTGATEPKQAMPGTIRGDFSNDSYDLADKEKRSLFNLIHASSSVEDAKREINIWFKK